jgi:anti-anti-sigma factor
MVQIVRVQNVVVFDLDESYPSLDVAALEEFGAALLAEAVRGTPPRIALDFSRTMYIGSSFMEILIRAWKRVCQRNGHFALCGLQPFCLDILATSRLDQIFPQYATRAEAVAALGKPEPQ